MTLIDTFEARAEEARDAAASNPDRLLELLRERDELLAQLTTALGTLSADEAPALSAALEGASKSTAALISQVAERTDALRRELREIGRGSLAAHAYLSPDSVRGRLNARR